MRIFCCTFRLSQGHSGDAIPSAQGRELPSGYSEVAQFILQSRDMHGTVQAGR